MKTRDIAKHIKSTALLVGVGGTSFLLGNVALAASSEAEDIEEVVVTGTHISGNYTEGASPVVVLDRKHIERSGAATLNELFRDSAVNTAGIVDEQFTQGFAPASAGINLRGLGMTRTLVLVDGRRLPMFPFGQDGSVSFVDINLIPLGTVERVEILKDGASAIYGADAVAGVVNIILRKEFDGVRWSAQYGSSSESDGQETRLGLTAGKSGERYSATFSLDHFSRDAVMAKDRSLSRSANGPIDDRSIAGNPGTIIGPTGPQPDARCPADRLQGPFCSFDFATYNTLIPGADRTGASLVFEYDISNNVKGYARGIFSHSDSERSLAPAASFFGIDGDNPNNPIPGADIGLIYRLLELGPRVDGFKTNSYNFFTGLSVDVGSWDLEFGTGVGDIDTVIKGLNGYATQSDVQSAIDSGSLNPFGDNPDFNPQSVMFQTKREGESKNYFVDFKASGEILEMRHGPLSVALGAEWRKEEFLDEFDSVTSSGAVIGTGGVSAEGDRNVRSAFVEFAVPLLNNLDVQLAGRYDRYNDFGGTFNPKLGVHWQATTNLAINGSMGSGFKAPAMHELYSGEIQAFDSVFDTPSCEAAQAANDPAQIDQYCNGVSEVTTFTRGNTELDPEDSKSLNLGFEWDVTSAWNMGIDFWQIKTENAVVSSAQFIVDNTDLFSENISRNDSGDIASVDIPFLNVGEQKIWGADLDTRYQWAWGEAGDLTLSLNASYLGSFKQQRAPGESPEQIAGFENPEWRAQSSLSWNRADVEASLTVNYVDGYERRETGDQISSWTTVNAQGSWKPQFVEDLTLSLGIDNLFDQQPPEDPFLEGWPFYNRALHNPRGRFLYLRGQYDF